MTARPDASGAPLVTGAVLAGGASRRMGRDKRAIEVDGTPLLTRAIGALASVCDEVLVVTGAENPADPRVLVGTDVRQVHDTRSGMGPLAGIEAALGEARNAVVLVVATDLPWLSAAVLRLLVDVLSDEPRAGAAALRVDESSPPEPLLAAYRRDVLPTARALLDAGERRAQALLDAVEVIDVGPDRWGPVDPEGRAATNVNTPDDLAGLPAPSSTSKAQP